MSNAELLAIHTESLYLNMLLVLADIVPDANDTELDALFFQGSKRPESKRQLVAI
jgi:hypothetical protein